MAHVHTFHINSANPNQQPNQPNHTTGHRENPLDCHNLGITLCDLYEKCGLPFQRGSAVGDRILGCAHP